MKATGIVRRIDDLGRVVIPKEIRRTMRIREGDPLEIYTSKDGRGHFQEILAHGRRGRVCRADLRNARTSPPALTVAVTDRDSVVAAAGSARRDLIGKRISTAAGADHGGPRHLPRTGPSERSVYVTDTLDRCCADHRRAHHLRGRRAGAGAVSSANEGENHVGETEYKLAQTIASFLGRHMES